MKKNSFKNLIKILTKRSLAKSLISLFLSVLTVAVVTFAWFAIRNSETVGNDVNLLEKVSGEGVMFLIDGKEQASGTTKIWLDEAAPGKIYTITLNISAARNTEDMSLRVVLGNSFGYLYDDYEFDEDLGKIEGEPDTTDDGVLSFFFISGIYTIPDSAGTGDDDIFTTVDGIRTPVVDMSKVYREKLPDDPDEGDYGFLLPCRSLKNAVDNSLQIGTCQPSVYNQDITIVFFIYVSDVDPSILDNTSTIKNLQHFNEWIIPEEERTMAEDDINRFQGSIIQISSISLFLQEG